MVIELDPTITVTGMFMGITVKSLSLPVLLQPYNFYLPVRFLPQYIQLKKIYLTHLFETVDNNHGLGEG